MIGPGRAAPRDPRGRRVDPGHAPPGRRRRPAQRRHRVRLPVDLRAARHRQPRGHGLRDRRRGHRHRRHPRGRRRPALGPRLVRGRPDRPAGARSTRPPTGPAPRWTRTATSPTSPRRSPRSSPTRTGPPPWAGPAGSARSTRSAGRRSRSGPSRSTGRHADPASGSRRADVLSSGTTSPGPRGGGCSTGNQSSSSGISRTRLLLTTTSVGRGRSTSSSTRPARRWPPGQAEPRRPGPGPRSTAAPAPRGSGTAATPPGRHPPRGAAASPAPGSSRRRTAATATGGSAAPATPGAVRRRRRRARRAAPTSAPSSGGSTVMRSQSSSSSYMGHLRSSGFLTSDAFRGHRRPEPRHRDLWTAALDRGLWTRPARYGRRVTKLMYAAWGDDLATRAARPGPARAARGRRRTPPPGQRRRRRGRAGDADPDVRRADRRDRQRLDRADGEPDGPVTEVLRDVTARLAGWEVEERLPIPPPEVADGERMDTLANIAVLRRPEELPPRGVAAQLAGRPHAGGDGDAGDVRLRAERRRPRRSPTDAPRVDAMVEELFPSAGDDRHARVLRQRR